ncbi:MAG: hypothetical protein U1F27_08390 [Turneriella sp.]
MANLLRDTSKKAANDAGTAAQKIGVSDFLAASFEVSSIVYSSAMATDSHKKESGFFSILLDGTFARLGRRP